MKNSALIIVSLVFLLALSNQGSAEYDLPEQEIYSQKTVEEKTGALRSMLNGSFESLGGSRYYSKETGQGHYGKFENVRWTLESETELRNNLLCPLYIIFKITDKDGKELSTGKKQYDYENGLIRITEYDAGSAKTEESVLPLKMPTTDYATMIYFLRPFMEKLMAGETIYFNFLSSEPGVYRLKARMTKEEHLKVGTQTIETVQVEVTPDMGALNIIVDRLVPPTLLWYGKNGSYPWLKYEGLESGRRSAHVITTVEQISPLKTQSDHE